MYKKPLIVNNLQANKALGQHFLHNELICEQIVNELETTTSYNLLEVGPGPGAITKYLIKLPLINFKCVELDAEKVQHLITKLKIPTTQVLHQDFLQSQPPFGNEPFVIIGNFPYNISTQIIFKVLEWQAMVPTVIGMFQKEVAQRLASPHGNKNYGITSVVTQAYYDIAYLYDVPPDNFTPPPKVMSGVIKMQYNHNPFGIDNYLAFKTMVKQAFSQRRKTLRNCFKGILLPVILQQPLFDNRAEQLSVQNFAELYHTYFKQ
jgi:16S rRNA (adenine1518-N6/adenine1519-N6)-dimethyltransferase